MQEAKQFEVKWRLVNLTTFMYGTKLHFNNDDIYFENPLMPSGTVILVVYADELYRRSCES